MGIILDVLGKHRKYIGVLFVPLSVCFFLSILCAYITVDHLYDWWPEEEIRFAGTGYTVLN